MSENKQYEKEYKVQAVKLAKKIGAVKAAKELQIPVNTLYGWIRKAKSGSLDIGCGERSPEESLNIAEENQQLKKRIKALEKENKRLSERLFSLPAVRNRERTKIDVYCNPDK